MIYEKGKEYERVKCSDCGDTMRRYIAPTKTVRPLFILILENRLLRFEQFTLKLRILLLQRSVLRLQLEDTSLFGCSEANRFFFHKLKSILFRAPNDKAQIREANQ